MSFAIVCSLVRKKKREAVDFGVYPTLSDALVACYHLDFLDMAEIFEFTMAYDKGKPMELRHKSAILRIEERP